MRSIYYISAAVLTTSVVGSSFHEKRELATKTITTESFKVTYTTFSSHWKQVYGVRGEGVTANGAVTGAQPLLSFEWTAQDLRAPVFMSNGAALKSMFSVISGLCETAKAEAFSCSTIPDGYVANVRDIIPRTTATHLITYTTLVTQNDKDSQVKTGNDLEEARAGSALSKLTSIADKTVQPKTDISTTQERKIVEDATRLSTSKVVTVGSSLITSKPLPGGTGVLTLTSTSHTSSSISNGIRSTCFFCVQYNSTLAFFINLLYVVLHL